MRVVSLFIIIILASCATASQTRTEARARARIKSFDREAQTDITTLLEMIEEQERVTKPGSKRYIPYEFRIPLDSAKKKEVLRFDPSIQFTSRTSFYLCIGDNATKELIYQIITLPYTYRIRFCPYE